MVKMNAVSVARIGVISKMLVILMSLSAQASCANPCMQKWMVWKQKSVLYVYGIKIMPSKGIGIIELSQNRIIRAQERGILCADLMIKWC
jgi:hypothetical protein